MIIAKLGRGIIACSKAPRSDSGIQPSQEMPEQSFGWERSNLYSEAGVAQARKVIVIALGQLAR